jgi:hypothetical protein
MSFPAVRISRSSIPAVIATALFHALVIALLITAMPKRFEKQTVGAVSRETITYLPLLAPYVEKKRRTSRGPVASRPATTYFNPDAFRALPALQPNTLGLQTALSACGLENYDMASAEVRTLCGKIGALLKNDPGHFGVKQDIANPQHWARELARREAPFLMPCASPNPPSPQLAKMGAIISINLDTLKCIYDLMMHPYDPEKRARYSE